MTPHNFKFNGDWEYIIELPMLSGFQERRGAYTSVSSDKPNAGLFRLEFEDDLTDYPDPYPEQLNTLQFIIENQEKIRHAIIAKALSELEEIKVNYGLENEEQYHDVTEQKIRSLIGISTLHFKIISKDGFSYFDVSGGCNWDEEHGLNILFHKDRPISFGGIDGGSTYEAQKDNGTANKERNANLHKEKPRKYTPHPKYNKLKPSQKAANDTYELNTFEPNCWKYEMSANNMHILIPIILALLVFSCNVNNNSNSGEKKATAQELTWPPVTYSVVKAYVTKTPWTRDLIVVNDTLSNLVSERFEITLDERLERKLLAILAKEESDGDTLAADCFYPRHGFVFWDSLQRPLAHISICFECGRLQAVPELDKFSLLELESFCREIGLPVFDNPFEHEKYFDSLKHTNGD